MKETNGDYLSNKSEKALFIPNEPKILSKNNISSTTMNLPIIEKNLANLNNMQTMGLHNQHNFNSASFKNIQNNTNLNNNNFILDDEKDKKLLENLENLLEQLKKTKAAFKDKSRLFCCGCFSICLIIFIFVFYIFDVLKYQETCNKTKKNYIEICDAPSIGFWPRFIFISISSILLIFSLYCTGPTVILFDPKSNKISIDKKKIFCLPSICEYKLDDLLYAYIESDTTDGTPNLSNFSFYSVILVFRHDQINLGLGRDCFLINEKIQLVNKINRYLDAYKTNLQVFDTNEQRGII
jgi:hypothetical protein